jgi:predicted lipoprotein with Yx(FWY)xxD motif
MRVMSWETFMAALAAVALLVAGEARAEGGVKVAKKDKVGSYLTDDKGMTLYVFKKDSPGKSACAGQCATNWPPFYSEKVEPGADVKAADFASITRDDGKKQTTYKGMPLYYFAVDSGPGDTKGQGVMDVWLVAAP